MTEPIPLDPVLIEHRGEFPVHSELPGRRVLTLAEARHQARQRLEDWLRCRDE